MNGKEKWKILFISVSMHFCYAHIYLGSSVYAETVRLIWGGGKLASVCAVLAEVFSCPFLCASCKPNDQVDLCYHRLSITFLYAPLSILPFLSLCGQTLLFWLGFFHSSDSFTSHVSLPGVQQNSRGLTASRRASDALGTCNNCWH